MSAAEEEEMNQFKYLKTFLVILSLFLMAGCGNSANSTAATDTEEQPVLEQKAGSDTSLEQKEDSDADSFETTDFVTESTTSGPAEMYAAYLQTLRAQKDMILAYDWQMRDVRDYGQESNWIRRPVAITDITGDELPELIFVAGRQIAESGSGIYVTQLLIATWRNGRVETLFCDTWDVQAGGGFYYCLFRENTEKTLYAYTSSGDETWTDEISFFKEENGKLICSSHLFKRQGPNPDDYNQSLTEYYLDGISTSETAYQSELDAIHSGLSEIVMFSGVSDDVMLAMFDRDGTTAMSYADAEQYLVSQSGDTAGGNTGSTAEDSSDSIAALDASAVFSDLPTSFWFASGAGAWSTDLTINTDGTIFGSYHDSNMGDMGTDYPNGTIEVCDFTGRFKDLQQTGPFEYSMRLSELTYENPVDTYMIADGVRYHYTEAYGLEGGETFLLYLPGAQTAGMPQEFLDWICMPRGWSSVQSELPCYGLYNVNTQCGFSGEKDTPVESSSADDGQILPESSSRLLTEADVSGFSSDQIQLAINEIYARHGYNFKKDEIRRWFLQYDWYNPVTDNMDQVTDSFSDVEKKNVAFLKSRK